MKLTPRRKQSPTTFERATGFAKLGVKGLVAQRIARRGLKTYKFSKRVVPLAGLAAIGALVAKKLRSGGDVPATPSYAPPASAGGSAGTSAAAAATAATGTPPVNGDGAAAGSDVSDALADAGAEGSGPDTPKEAGAPGIGDEQPGGEGGKGDPPTEEALDVEAPNESTPPPPGKSKK